jgi:hypothetical protein
MRRWILALLPLLAWALGTAPLPALAQTATGQTTDRGSFSVLFENDLFDQTDRDYTSGIEFAYTTAPRDTPDWAVAIARGLPFFLQEGDVRTRYVLGQAIFTPADISNPNPPPGARPYAGFLYGAMGVVADSGHHLDQLQVTLGIIGPASLAAESQRLAHNIFNGDKPMGWHTQLRNEPGLIITYQRSDKLFEQQSVLGATFDIQPHFGVAIGNVYDYVNAGAMARLGFNLPRDFGPMRIDPSLPGSDYFEPTAGLGGYLFAGVDGRAIARNLFLDGSSFRTSQSVSKYNLVGDVILGAALTFESMRLAFTHVIRSKEYKTQTEPAGYGSVSLTFRF